MKKNLSADIFSVNCLICKFVLEFFFDFNQKRMFFEALNLQ